MNALSDGWGSSVFGENVGWTVYPEYDRVAFQSHNERAGKVGDCSSSVSYSEDSEVDPQCRWLILGASAWTWLELVVLWSCDVAVEGPLGAVCGGFRGGEVAVETPQVVGS